MDPDLAVGLWHSSFGPVKIQFDQGSPDRVEGVWVYDRSGEEVVGVFAGGLTGNVLEFEWEEPGDPEPLRGGGYLVFDQSGKAFDGKWWSETGDRDGAWNGWRDDPYVGRARGAASVPDGSEGDGGEPDEAPVDLDAPPPSELGGEPGEPPPGGPPDQL